MRNAVTLLLTLLCVVFGAAEGFADCDPYPENCSNTARTYIIIDYYDVKAEAYHSPNELP